MGSKHSHGHDHGPDTVKIRRNRIIRLGSMLVAIVGFCVVELVVGHVAGSLALVADSFHMMSDALSLIIAAVAIRIGGKINKEKNTFGWLRAEILGAVINGVFLLALCLTISLHALERIMQPEAVEKPWLVLWVGGLGLLINIFGMFLFHEHGHSHSHGHDHKSTAKKRVSIKRDGSIRVTGCKNIWDNAATGGSSRWLKTKDSGVLVYGDEVSSPIEQRRVKGVRARAGSLSEMSSIRRKINFVVHEELCARTSSMESLNDDEMSGSETDESEDQRAVSPSRKSQDGKESIMNSKIPEEPECGKNHSASQLHSDDCFEEDKKEGFDVELDKKNEKGDFKTVSIKIEAKDSSESEAPPHVHVHEHNQNMRAVFLHVLSDALASLLVIASASAHILMEKYGQDYGGEKAAWLPYIDPILSIVIVVIITVPTVKLVKEASAILLNNVPGGLSPEEIAADIMKHFPEIVSVHELYLWHLTADIIVATVHVVLKIEPNDKDFQDHFFKVSKDLKEFFHLNGIHSTTTQIEVATSENAKWHGECNLRCKCATSISGVSRGRRRSGLPPLQRGDSKLM